MPQTLAQAVRAKHPGAYDDMTDVQLEAAVSKKFPGVYDDLPITMAEPARTPGRPPGPATIGEQIRAKSFETTGRGVDQAIGVGKGALKTVIGAGKYLRKIPGVNALDRLVPPMQVDITAHNRDQRIGMGAEQIAEFFVPVAGVAGKVKKGAEIVKSGALTLAQSGSPAAAGASAALTAVLPGAGAAQRASKSLQSSAERTMAQALGATKEGMKAEAKRLAPQMLERGVSGTRKAMLERASETAKAVGAQLDDAYKVAAEAGETVSGNTIRQGIQQAAGGLHTQAANGKLIPIAGTEGVVRKLGKLDSFIEKLGPDIPVDQAAAIKKTWDHVVSKAGLYGPKATASATDNADAWAVREASTAIRGLLNTNPTLAALNKEASFWIGLRKVLTATELRAQAQSGGLMSGVAGAAGASSGFASGGSVGGRMGNAVIGGLAARQLVRGMTSPWWRTSASAPAKKILADALASGSNGKILSAIGAVTKAMPAQVSR